ncbi:hypothetical protein [Burkholderia ubonensis]|nr:hypothetical protein [Burkholderia ubonensis]
MNGQKAGGASKQGLLHRVAADQAMAVEVIQDGFAVSLSSLQ